jgi:methyl-accepting chemotaxis protein
VAAGLIIGGGMKLGFPDLPAVSAMIIVAAATTAGLAMNAFFFFAVKHRLGELRRVLIAELPDPSDREVLVRRLPLSTKLLISLSGVAVSTVLFSVFLAEMHARQPLLRQSTDLQQRYLTRVAPGLSAPGSAELERIAGEAVELGIASRLVLVAPDVEEGPINASAWAAVRESSAGYGDSSDLGSRTAFAWRRLEDGRLLVAVLDEATLREHLGSLWTPFGLLLAVATGIAVLLARLIANDVRAGTRMLSDRAQLIASGDFREGEAFESEDELGDLGRAFERMGRALRGTVEGVVEAADRLEGTTRELEVVGAGVSSATVDQAQAVVGARGSVERLEEQMGGIAQSTQALSSSMEESGSSALELSASGEQLKQTARGLEERIAEVSGSLGQAVVSVREVGEQTETLFQASAETSTSMEEMASSLREVDANAEEMGRLSKRVVDAAEGGASRVLRSMEGMEAIREATATAEGVIRSLSGRATEIGAIVDVIDTVADETNLLALNAAIIAAQAGENGRAFSVVADEIKELADRVMSSTKEIGGLIRSVQTESRSAHAAIERGMGKVEEGVELSSQAGDALGAITQAARESGARTSEIVAAVREQSGAASHVVGLMESVRDGVERIRLAGREQDRGHDVVMTGTVAMHEVAGQVHRTTEEQAQGARRIRDGVEGVREAVAAIHQALTEQRAACGGAAGDLRRVAERTESHQESARRMAEATRDLRAQAESLRDDVRRFRTRRDGSTRVGGVS